MKALFSEVLVPVFYDIDGKKSGGYICQDEAVRGSICALVGIDREELDTFFTKVHEYDLLTAIQDQMVKLGYYENVVDESEPTGPSEELRKTPDSVFTVTDFLNSRGCDVGYRSVKELLLTHGLMVGDAAHALKFHNWQYDFKLIPFHVKWLCSHHQVQMPTYMLDELDKAHGGAL